VVEMSVQECVRRSSVTYEEAHSPDFVDAELCRQDGEPRHDVLVVVNVMRM